MGESSDMLCTKCLTEGKSVKAGAVAGYEYFCERHLREKVLKTFPDVLEG